MKPKHNCYCFICSKKSPSTPNDNTKNNKDDELIADLWDNLCNIMKWKPPPAKYKFNFETEIIPFCSDCKYSIRNLFQLNHELKEVCKNMEQIIVNLSAKLLEAKIGEKGKRGNSVDDRLEEIAGFYRNQTRKRFSVKIKLQRDPHLECIISSAACRASKVLQNETLADDFAMEKSESVSENSFPGNFMDTEDYDDDGGFLDKEHVKDIPEVKIEQNAAMALLFADMSYQNIPEVKIEQNGAMALIEDDMTDSDYDPINNSEDNAASEISDDGSDFPEESGDSKRERKIRKRKVSKTSKSKGTSGRKKLSKKLVNKFQFEMVGEEYKCGICGVLHKELEKMKQHVRQRHIDNKRGCIICGETFSKTQLLDEHLLTHDEPDLFKCEECGKPWPSYHSLRNHIFKAHKADKFKFEMVGEEYKCGDCGVLRKEYDKMKNHVLRCHMEPRKWDESFRKKRASRKRSSRKRKKLVPAVSNLTVDNPSDNLFVVNGKFTFEKIKEQEFKCTDCGFLQKTLDDMKKHIKSQHKDNTKKFICHICAKCYISENALKDHISTHDEKQSSMCEDCGKILPTPRRLQLHRERVHLAKPFTPTDLAFPCQHCGKTWNTKGRLNAHIKNVHEKQVCPICGKQVSLVWFPEHVFAHTNGDVKKEIRMYDMWKKIQILQCLERS